MTFYPRPERVRLLRWLLALGIASTSVHYAHNFVMAEMYPPVPIIFPTDLAYRVGIVVFWPLLTLIGLHGYRLYVRGETRRAAWALVAYSTLGITSVGHFIGGVPDIAPVFFATMFTDFLTGLAILAFALRELSETRAVVAT